MPAVPEQRDDDLVPPMKVLHKRLNGVYRADAGFSGPTRRYVLIVALLVGLASLPTLAAITAGSDELAGGRTDTMDVPFLPPASPGPVRPPAGDASSEQGAKAAVRAGELLGEVGEREPRTVPDNNGGGGDRADGERPSGGSRGRSDSVRPSGSSRPGSDSRSRGEAQSGDGSRPGGASGASSGSGGDGSRPRVEKSGSDGQKSGSRGEGSGPRGKPKPGDGDDSAVGHRPPVAGGVRPGLPTVPGLPNIPDEPTGREQPADTGHGSPPTNPSVPDVPDDADNDGSGHEGPDHDGSGDDEPDHDEPDHDEPDHDGPGHDGSDHDQPDHDGPGHHGSDHDQPDHDGSGHDEPDDDQPGHDGPAGESDDDQAADDSDHEEPRPDHRRARPCDDRERAERSPAGHRSAGDRPRFRRRSAVTDRPHNVRRPDASRGGQANSGYHDAAESRNSSPTYRGSHRADERAAADQRSSRVGRHHAAPDRDRNRDHDADRERDED